MADYQSRVKTVIVLAVIALAIITALTLERGGNGKSGHVGVCVHHIDRSPSGSNQSASAFYPDKEAGYRHIVIR